MTPELYYLLADSVDYDDDIDMTYNERLTCLNAFMRHALESDLDGSGYVSINKIDQLISEFKEKYKIELEAEEVGEI